MGSKFFRIQNAKVVWTIGYTLFTIVSYFIYYNVFQNGGLSLGEIVIRGLVQGLIFGIIIYYFVNYYGTNIYKKIEIPLNSNENQIFDGPATLYLDKAGIGGKLVLTEYRLLFKSQRESKIQVEKELPLEHITEIAKMKSYGLINNIVRVTTAGKLQFEFVVPNQKEWLEKLTKREIIV